MASISAARVSLSLAKRSSDLAPRLAVRPASFGRVEVAIGGKRECWLKRGVRVRASAEVLQERKGEEKEEEVEERPLKVGIVCGGPSAERGISLNSARSVLDHIQVTYCSLIWSVCA